MNEPEELLFTQVCAFIALIVRKRGGSMHPANREAIFHGWMHVAVRA